MRVIHPVNKSDKASRIKEWWATLSLVEKQMFMEVMARMVGWPRQSHKEVTCDRAQVRPKMARL